MFKNRDNDCPVKSDDLLEKRTNIVAVSNKQEQLVAYYMYIDVFVA